MIRFAQPYAFLLLPAVALIVYLSIRHRRDSNPRMLFSSVRILGDLRPSLKVRMRPLPTILFTLALTLTVVAFARPQSPWQEHKRRIEGIDIMLVIDVSESMRALDFHPNRLQKAKQVVQEFVQGRKNDQIGVVIFAKETFTLCPLTHDYAALETFIDRINFDLVDGQATAIGMGLANAVNKLKDSQSKSKVCILLTDGENNSGKIDPLMAAEIAKQFEVRTYTIGVGSKGYVDMPVRVGGRVTVNRIPSNLDVRTLSKIAEMTGGKFFEATDGKSLEQIYEQIDEMERTEVEVTEINYFDDRAHYLIIPALLLVGVGIVLEGTWLRSFP